MWKNTSPLSTLQHWDVSLCISCNRIHRHPWLTQLFRIASRLGDGLFWYALMAILPLVDGYAGLQVSLHMAAAGLGCLVLYKLLKKSTVRPRPFTRHGDIRLLAAPLDQYSFPSGHTLHAVAFSFVVLNYYPALAWLIVPFSLMVALSRPMLGLHYPSDVLAGGSIGALIALMSFELF